MISAIALSATIGCGENVANQPPPQLPWNWSAARSDVFDCMRREGEGLIIEPQPIHKADRGYSIFAGRSGGLLFTTHFSTDSIVFARKGGVLYVAEYRCCSFGGCVTAVDIATERTMWRRPLQALGMIAHSKYLNDINIDVVEDRVEIHGQESAGRYIEILDRHTGRRLTHMRPNR
ncbi:MAG: hypothetical protein QM811_26490 [Pirellulales bacterium]